MMQEGERVVAMTTEEYDVRMRTLAQRYKRATEILQAINLDELKKEYSEGKINATEYRRILNAHTDAAQDITRIANEVSDLQKQMTSEQRNEQRRKEEDRQNRIRELKYQYLHLFEIIGTATQDDLFLRYMQGDTSYEDFSRYLATYKDYEKQMAEMRAEIERLESGGKLEDTPSQNGEEKPQQKTEQLKKESKDNGKDKGRLLAVLMFAGIVSVLVGLLVFVISISNRSTPKTYQAGGTTYTSRDGKVFTQVPSSNSTATTTTTKTKPETKKAETKAPETTPKKVLVKQAEPENGEILRYGEGYWQSYYSSITVTAPEKEAVVVKLKRTVPGKARKETVVAFYVCAGETVEMEIPAISMYVFFAQGETWYGYDDLFGDSTAYGKDSEQIDFSWHTVTYTLQPVSDGNFTTKTTSESDFAD